MDACRDGLPECVILCSKRIGIRDRHADPSFGIDGQCERIDERTVAADGQQNLVVLVLLQVVAVSGVVRIAQIVDRYHFVAGLEARFDCRGVGYAVHDEGEPQGEEVFVSLFLPHTEQGFEGNVERYRLSAPFDYHAAAAVGNQQVVLYPHDVVDLLAVDRHETVAVPEAHFVSRRVEIIAPFRVLVRKVGVAPGVANGAVDDDGQQDVHHDAGHHYQEPLPGGFGPEFVGFDRLFHLFLVHRFVDHSRNLHISSER